MCLFQTLHRRLPGMTGQCEFGIMNRYHIACLEIRCRLRRFLWQHMDIMPLQVILPVFQKSQIKPSKRISDIPEMRSIPTVSTVVDLMGRGNECIRCPFCRISFQKTSGEMLRRQYVNMEIRAISASLSQSSS